jgi:hypothetical protein
MSQVDKSSVMAVLGCNGLRCVINIMLSLSGRRPGRHALKRDGTVTDKLFEHELQKSPRPWPRASCPDYYADLFTAPLHEVLPKASPPLHVMQSGGIPNIVSQ